MAKIKLVKLVSKITMVQWLYLLLSCALITTNNTHALTTSKTPASNLSYSSANATQVPLTIVTENMPPMQIADNKKPLDGFAVEIVNALLKQVGQSNKITVTNWARAYKLALDKQNVMIFSITRNPLREDLFKWVGDIFTLENHLWRLNYRNELDINTISQAKRRRIAVPRDDIQHHYLVKQGFELNKNLIPVPKHEQAINLLLRERVDYFAGSSVFLYYRLKQLGINTATVKPVLKMDKSINTLYIAFSKQTDDQIVNLYRKNLKQLKASNIYLDIINKWQIQVDVTP